MFFSIKIRTGLMVTGTRDPKIKVFRLILVRLDRIER
jgi:hypothetical protein